MRTTTLGGKGPEVGVIGLGCMGMTFACDMQAPRDDATSIAVIHQALDLGMTLLDTADAYGPHSNGELVGRALAGGYRQRAVLATKVGLLTGPTGVAADSASNAPGAGRDGRPEHVRRSIGESLRRLPRFQQDALRANLAIVGRVRQVAERVGATPAQVALAWVLAQGRHVVPIPATRDQPHHWHHQGDTDGRVDQRRTHQDRGS
jgi:aryl-alcohol dehydrogenase-like predicted oxidoreductase